ncbi:hypothetical protein BC937DRAFT_89837, partial [Endogone sp. FLAS-F59071]
DCKNGHGRGFDDTTARDVTCPFGKEILGTSSDRFHFVQLSQLCIPQENEDPKSLAGYSVRTARRRLAGSRRNRRRAHPRGMSPHVQLRPAIQFPTFGNSSTPTFHHCFCTRHARQYELNNEVVIWMNTVGPLSNRQETYEYYQLPYCHGNAPVEHHHETLGEALQGMDLINSGIPMKFRKTEANVTICERELGMKEVNLFKYAVSNQYWYQMFLDDLPVWGFVGETDSTSDTKYLFTHKEFNIEFNSDRIVQVTLDSSKSNPVALVWNGPPLKVRFTYSVTWSQTNKDFNTRFERFLDADFFEHKIHWFSIINSFMMVLFLTGLVSVILLRTLRRDYARYDKEEGLGDLDHDLGDDYGWKQVHGDVFRPPQRLMLFSALLGTGNQLAILMGVVILYTILGDLYAERATILTATIFLYALTSGVAGYTSASYYAKYGGGLSISSVFYSRYLTLACILARAGKDWIRNMILTASLWPAVLTLVTGYINTVAIYYSSSRAIAFTIMVGARLAMLAIWLFLCFPLTLLGAIVGRNWGGQPDFPTRVNPIPRPIPEKVWYAEPLIVIALGGILPFGSIFIEVYFIFTSFWGSKIYYVYGFMLLVYVILLVVTACVTVVSTYFLLNSEDHR